MMTIQDALATAWRHRQAGDFVRAGAMAQQVLQAAADHFGALCLHGDVSWALGDLDQAVVSYRRAAVLRPEHAETALALGNCLLMQKRLDEAAACYHRALQLRPNYPQAHTNLGSVLQEQGELEAAVACHREAARIDPQFVDAHFNLGNACKELGRNEEAVAGVPTWLALPTVPHWSWLLDREDTPWYPTRRLFRQRRPGQWGEVFERMARELIQMRDIGSARRGGAD